MRIVELNPFYFPYAGGIERRIRETASRLAKRHEVHIVTAAQPGTEPGITLEGSVHVHRLPSRFPLKRFYNPPPVFSSGIRAKLDALQPDVVDYHFRWSPSYNKAFLRWPGAKVATYHNTWGEGSGLLGLASRIQDARFRRQLDAAKRIVAVSDFIRDDLQRHGITPNKIDVVANGIAPQTRSSDAPGMPEPYVVFVGRLVGVKGLDVLVDAMPTMPGIHVVLVGHGPLASKLQKQADALGVADRLHLTGWVDEERKKALLQGALAYVHPARFEAFGISLLEAMDLGVPVIAAASGGIPQAVGDAGILLGHDPSDWATAVRRLAEHPDERARLVQAGRVQAARFSWDELTTQLETVYARALQA